MTRSPRLGIALGSGSARGWAHIGVLRALEAAGIEPNVVCGTSIGALVGGAYAAGQLDALETWVRSLNLLDVVGFMDVTLTRGGLIAGEKLFKGLRRFQSDVAIEDLAKRFAAVATDFGSGREIWLQRGSLLDAVRASTSLPGIFPPVKLGSQWLLDGGLVNPVPVSVCRALGAQVVIAVNLNGDLTSRNVPARPLRREARGPHLASHLKLRGAGAFLAAQLLQPKQKTPGFFEVLAGALYIMQDRITRSRMAGDPPDVMLTPRLAQIRLLEFHRAEEAIDAGRDSVAPFLAEVQRTLTSPGES
jgi:NTE family protein